MRSKLRPFWYYYGGKYRFAPKYRPPEYRKIIEPFAGAAGYSTRYFERDIFLCDSDPIICGLWEYLIRVTESEIIGLPLAVENVDELSICQEARWLIGFYLSHGTTSPRKTITTRFKRGLRPNSYWGEAVRSRIAHQVHYIRHWKVKNASYQALSNEEATWFIDPPYSGKDGKQYRDKIDDYSSLAEWVRSRAGQVIACEQSGAEWLPFKSAGIARANSPPTGKSYCHEVVWYGGSDEIVAEPTPLLAKES